MGVPPSLPIHSARPARVRRLYSPGAASLPASSTATLPPAGTIASGTAGRAVASDQPSRETTSIASPVFSPSICQRTFRSLPTSSGRTWMDISAAGRSSLACRRVTVPLLRGTYVTPRLSGSSQSRLSFNSPSWASAHRLSRLVGPPAGQPQDSRSPCGGDPGHGPPPAAAGLVEPDRQPAAAATVTMVAAVEWNSPTLAPLQANLRSPDTDRPPHRQGTLGRIVGKVSLVSVAGACHPTGCRWKRATGGSRRPSSPTHC